MRFLILVVLFVLVSCKGGSSASSNQASSPEDFSGHWGSSVNFSIDLNQDGSGTFRGVCEYDFDRYEISFDSTGRGVVEFYGCTEKRNGTGICNHVCDNTEELSFLSFEAIRPTNNQNAIYIKNYSSYSEIRFSRQ